MSLAYFKLVKGKYMNTLHWHGHWRHELCIVQHKYH